MAEVSRDALERTTRRTTWKQPRQQVAWMAFATAISLFGMAVHTVREFGLTGLWVPSTGMLPLAALQLGLLTWWVVALRRGAAIALAGTALVQLVGGAILSVLPLPFLPFEPDQSIQHYLSHLVFGIAQLPLLVLPLQRMR